MSVAIARPQKSIGLLYQGISGSGIVPFIKVPSSQQSETGKTGRDVQLGLDPFPSRVNVINKTSSFTTAHMAPSCRVLNINIMRNPKGDPTEGLQVPEGFGRGQKRGLAFMPQHPLNARILVRRDNFFSTQPTKLGTPR